MKNLLAFLIAAIALPTLSLAGVAEIKGRIINDRNEPIEFASIALLYEKDSTLALANITDSSGNYTFQHVAYGTYLLAVSSSGTSREYYGPLVIDSTSTSIEIPTITLVQSKELNEVVIKAIKPLFIHKPGMLVMDVEGSALRSAGTALDLLRKVPGVVIDNNNNIIFRGKNGVNITIDDKSTYLNNDQLVDFLQNMSASEVIRIEIVSNPSAKFDAAGKGGYINIVTKKKIRQGLNGSAIIWSGYGKKLKYGGGADLAYGKKKFNFYGNYYYGNRDNLEELDINRKILYADTLSTFDQESDMNEHNIFHNSRIGFDYFPDSVTSMGLMVSGRIFDKYGKNYTATSITLDPGDSAFFLQQTNIKNGLDYRAGTGVYYKKVLDTLGGEFSANADLLLYNNRAKEDFQTHYFDLHQTETEIPYIQRNRTGTDINIIVGKLDYIKPFKKYDSKLETGIKSSVVETKNSLHFDVLNNQTWENDTLRTNDFIYKEMINAAYVNGSFKWKKIGVQLGLRAEQTISDGNSPTLDKQIVNQYIKLFPSVFLSRQFGKNHNVSTGYSRRIDRPSYEDLNPFIFYLDQYTYEVGNPFLKPQFTDAFSVEYSLLDAIYTTVEWSRTRNAMTDVTEQIDSTGVGFLSHVNLNTVDNASFSLAFPIPIAKWFMVENSLTETYSSYRSNLFGSELNREAWTFSANSSCKLTLPKELSVETSLEYHTKMRLGVFDIKEAVKVDMGITKNFFRKTLVLSCTVEDIFGIYKDIITINFQGQDMYLYSYHENQKIWLRLRYIFGQAQQKRKSGYRSASDDLQNRTNSR